MTEQLILASASARRKDILCSLGPVFEVLVPEVEEVLHLRNPRRTAEENAVRKNEWSRQRKPDCLIISADTVLNFEGRVMAKPQSMEEACDFFRRLSGATHVVLTAVALFAPGTGMSLCTTESTVVFKVLSESVIQQYFSLVDPLDKAGGYDINQHDDLIIESHSGSRTNIMGLARETVEPWLRARGCL